jgi:hypothetical protein
VARVEWDTKDVERLYATYGQATRDFDTAIRALSGGALAISLTFVHDIAPHPHHNWTLAAAWCLFVLALAVNLWSFLTAEAEASEESDARNESDPTEAEAFFAEQVGTKPVRLPGAAVGLRALASSRRGTSRLRLELRSRRGADREPDDYPQAQPGRRPSSRTRIRSCPSI